MNGNKHMDNIVGMFWNCNEADILEETLTDAIKHVDSIFIADDGSTDNSWEIIQSFAQKHPDKVEQIRNKRDDPRDKGQRQAMLSEIQRRYKPQDTWVQIMESDIMILDTDIRESLKEWASLDISMAWHLINACRVAGTWKEADTYPNWPISIKDIMPFGHWMEVMTYTFRPMPKLEYNLDTWRPWPQGWTHYIGNQVMENTHRGLSVPLLTHYGYRGPTHFYEKFKKMGKADGHHSKYKTWDLRSVESVEKTVSFFNGEWTGEGSRFPMSRGGWIGWRKG